MNMISFTNFTNIENPNAFLPSAEKNGKSEDFSALLQSIGLALQNNGLHFSNGFEQVQTFSAGEQNFVVGGSPVLSENAPHQIPVLVSNAGKTVSFNTNSSLMDLSATSNPQTNLPPAQIVEETIHISSLKAEILNSAFKIEPAISLSSAENPISIPTHFQSLPKIPTVQNYWSENPVSENLIQSSQTVSPTPEPPNIQSSGIKDFEIISDNQEIDPQLMQNNSPDLTPKLEQNNSSVLLTLSEAEIKTNQITQPLPETFQQSQPLKEISLQTDSSAVSFKTSETEVKENKKISLPMTEANPEVSKSPVGKILREDNLLLSNSLAEKNIPQNPSVELPSDLKAIQILPPPSKAGFENAVKPEAAPQTSAEIPVAVLNPAVSNSAVKVKTDFTRQPKFDSVMDSAAVFGTSIEPDLPLEKTAENIQSLPIQPKVPQDFLKEQPNKNLTSQLTDLSAKPSESIENQTPDIEINSFPPIQEKILPAGNDSIAFSPVNENSSQPVLADKNPLNLHPELPNLTHSKLVKIKLPTEESVRETSNEFKLNDNEISGLLDKFAEKSNISLNPQEKPVINPDNLPNSLKPSIQPIESAANQTAEIGLNQTSQTDSAAKTETAETDFAPPKEKEIKLPETVANSSVIFDKVMENFTKEAKAVEKTFTLQAEPGELNQQISPHLLELAMSVEKKQEKEILKMRLHPAELGTVEITLEKTGSGLLNAQFKTETADAQQTLSNNLEQLRDNLQNAGWEVGKMDILQSSASTTDNQNRQNNQQKSEWIENFAFNRSAEQPDETENISPTRLLNLQA